MFLIWELSSVGYQRCIQIYTCSEIVWGCIKGIKYYRNTSQMLANTHFFFNNKKSVHSTFEHTRLTWFQHSIKKFKSCMKSSISTSPLGDKTNSNFFAHVPYDWTRKNISTITLHTSIISSVIFLVYCNTIYTGTPVKIVLL